MNDNFPILTIAIPTYNRCDSLKYLIDKILPHLNNKLQLLIIDNNSSDNTEEYSLIWKEKNRNIGYIKNNSNLGGVVNMLRCIEFSTGKYVWLLGDDDDINIYYLAELVDILSNEDAYSYHLIPQSRQSRKISKYVFETKIDFINNFYDITALHLMSSNIYNIDEAKKYLSEAYRLVHLQHAFSLFHLKFLEENKLVKILKLPILKEERIIIKRWSKFTAHIDALETTYLLFGKDLLNKEYKIRKKELLRVAVISLFDSKDEGFNLNEVKRIIRLVSLKELFIPFLFLAILSLKDNKYSSYLLIYILYIVFFFKYRKRYKNSLKDYLRISRDDDLDVYMKKIFNLSKENFFKN